MTAAHPADDAHEWLAALRDELLPALARADLRIDLRVRLAIEAWIDAAQRRGELPAGREDIRNVLRAIVCKSQRDQVAFDVTFDGWVRGRHAELSLPAPAGPGDGSKPSGEIRAALVATTYRPAPACSLSSGSRVGPVREILSRAGATAPVVVPLPAPASAASPGALPVVRNVKSVTTPIEIELPRPPWLLGVHPGWYAAVVLLLGGAGYTVRTTRRQQVARIGVGARANLRELEVFARQLLPVSGARRQALREAARALRRPVPVEGRVLDLPASVHASSRAAGRFASVFRGRMATPDYLVLIDRSHPGEPFGQLAHETARGLAAEGVSLQVFEFDRDPRWVAPFGVALQPTAASAGATSRWPAWGRGMPGRACSSTPTGRACSILPAARCMPGSPRPSRRGRSVRC